MIYSVFLLFNVNKDGWSFKRHTGVTFFSQETPWSLLPTSSGRWCRCVSDRLRAPRTVVWRNTHTLGIIIPDFENKSETSRMLGTQQSDSRGKRWENGTFGFAIQCFCGLPVYLLFSHRAPTATCQLQPHPLCTLKITGGLMLIGADI